jgi:hypothetical protein
MTQSLRVGMWPHAVNLPEGDHYEARVNFYAADGIRPCRGHAFAELGDNQ